MCTTLSSETSFGLLDLVKGQSPASLMENKPSITCEQCGTLVTVCSDEGDFTSYLVKTTRKIRAEKLHEVPGPPWTGLSY
jgi:hypothetical protein